jgi:hypothetical protein
MPMAFSMSKPRTITPLGASPALEKMGTLTVIWNREVD